MLKNKKLKRVPPTALLDVYQQHRVTRRNQIYSLPQRRSDNSPSLLATNLGLYFEFLNSNDFARALASPQLRCLAFEVLSTSCSKLGLTCVDEWTGEVLGFLKHHTLAFALRFLRVELNIHLEGLEPDDDGGKWARELWDIIAEQQKVVFGISRMSSFSFVVSGSCETRSAY